MQYVISSERGARAPGRASSSCQAVGHTLTRLLAPFTGFTADRWSAARPPRAATRAHAPGRPRRRYPTVRVACPPGCATNAWRCPTIVVVANPISVFDVNPQLADQRPASLKVVSVAGAIVGNDPLTVNALAGDDVIDATGVAAGSVLATLDGGAVVVGAFSADCVKSATAVGQAWPRPTPAPSTARSCGRSAAGSGCLPGPTEPALAGGVTSAAGPGLQQGQRPDRTRGPGAESHVAVFGLRSPRSGCVCSAQGSVA